MQDFASAAMIRVIQAGAARLGLPAMGYASSTQERVPLQDKRALVGQVLRTGGWSALLQLGQGIHDVKDDPLMHLLVQPGQPWRVLGAWLRLERYLHSRHRIEQMRLKDCAVQHQHTGRGGSVQPLVAESWLVLGVLVALLERSGCQAVVASLPDARRLLKAGRVCATERQLDDWATSGSVQTWQLSWRGGHPEVLDARFKPKAASTLKEQLVGWMQDTDNWQPELAQVASALNLSQRSVQRKLGAQGMRFVDVVGQARAERASQLLTHSRSPLAEIGFASGYTDQAHFCRDFKRRCGLTPKAFRDTSLAVSKSLAG